MNPVFDLDPRAQCARIACRLGTVTFSWDTTRSLEMALFRTFASSRIGALLDRTGEFALKTRALALRWLPKRRRPRLRTQLPRADYPQGYRIESLGPPPIGE